MLIKSRYESAELKLFRSLNNRMNLSEKDFATYRSLEKGFIGEKKFDEWTEQLPDNFLIINDLLLECNNTTFQIDSVVIASGPTVFIFEVKNFEGDYVVDVEEWSTLYGTNINNPIHQLKRCETLLCKLLKQLGINPNIVTNVVFINPEFTLYNSPLDLPIIFPTQIKRFMEKLKLKSAKLRKNEIELAKLLVSMHKTESPYKRTPPYSYELLQKGIPCVNCQSFNLYYTEKMIVCENCRQKEIAKAAILRSVEEFKLLFPDKRITTNGVYEWCNLNNSKKTIFRILSTNFKQVGQGKSAYFIHKGQ
ncbi:NERD domain-containing protein [Anaerobacillus sp. CMMVII]|uniref:nuclease-related domain-containing protein n=1 Tax=Anaerobacillus sp. CMMVII TaxID=2755588 RepID=UPI0021B7364F|nr:nuclease-related domain-containing protein [Anaerobacillus sp. CMMVII]MCT8139459.1 NERD domain-containing protein [Anaerobacillus sp. CMMVII]